MVQYDGARNGDVKRGGTSAVLGDVHKAVAQRHLPWRQTLALVAEHEGGRACTARRRGNKLKHEHLSSLQADKVMGISQKGSRLLTVPRHVAAELALACLHAAVVVVPLQEAMQLAT